jgi:hypothetical protein
MKTNLFFSFIPFCGACWLASTEAASGQTNFALLGQTNVGGTAEWVEESGSFVFLANGSDGSGTRSALGFMVRQRVKTSWAMSAFGILFSANYRMQKTRAEGLGRALVGRSRPRLARLTAATFLLQNL